MPRFNLDPYTGGHLFALVDRVTCLLDSEDEVMATVRALEEEGVATDDIDIFVGEQGARLLDLSGREHGRVMRLLRRLEAAVGDESGPNHRIDEALRRGATLLCVKVHARTEREGSCGPGPQGAARARDPLLGTLELRRRAVEPAVPLLYAPCRENSG